MKKESLSVMTVKTLLAVVIFAGVGTIIIGGGYIIGEYSKNGTANQITKPVNQETENYYDVLEKKCDDGKCCLRSLKIMKENNYKEIDQDGNCPEGFEESFLPLKGIAGFCENSLKWCQPIQTKIISIKTDKIEYFTGEQVKIAIKNETDGIMYIPEYITIERFYDNKWEGIVRRTCPWDRLSYNDGYYFEAHSNNIYDWNQEEKGCDMSKFMTYRTQVPAGKYRVNILRSIKGEEKDEKKIIYSNEFIIVENEKYCIDEQNNRREIGETWSESPTMFKKCGKFGNISTNYVLSCDSEKLVVSGGFGVVNRKMPSESFSVGAEGTLGFTWTVNNNEYLTFSGGPGYFFVVCDKKKAAIFYAHTVEMGSDDYQYNKRFFDGDSVAEISCSFRKEDTGVISKYEDGKRIYDFKPLKNGKEICQEIKERHQELEETIVDTSDWQTYRNEEFGFEVKYPSILVGKEDFYRAGIYNEAWTLVESYDKNIIFGTQSSRAGGGIWGIFIKDDMKSCGGRGIQFADRKENIKEIKIGELNAKLITVTTNSYPNWISEIICIAKDDKVFEIGNGAVKIPEFKSFYNSFKFIEKDETQK